MFDPPGQPLQPPSLEFPLGTDDFGRSVLDLVIGGSDLAAGGVHGYGDDDDGGRGRRIGGGYYGGRTDTVLRVRTGS